MFRRTHCARSPALLACVAALCCTTFIGAEEIKNPASIRIGIAGSLFRGIPEPLLKASIHPFKMLMETQTGLRGDFAILADAGDLADQLSGDRLQLGVFMGIEFAWARSAHPELVPLMIAVNQHRHLHAHVLVRHDNSARAFADLAGKSLALPGQSREHCRLFLERRGRQTPVQIVIPPGIEDALDDVVDGTIEAALVDGVSLQCYQRRKPARFERLRELEKSEAFPTAVVVHHAGALDDAALRSFRDGLVNANKTAFGRQLLTLWRMTAFEPIPDDYTLTLTRIVQAYPSPRAVPAKSHPKTVSLGVTTKDLPGRK